MRDKEWKFETRAVQDLIRSFPKFLEISIRR